MLFDILEPVVGFFVKRLARLRRGPSSEAGSSTVETVIIVAASAAMAIAAMAAITLAVNGKVAGLQL